MDFAEITQVYVPTQRHSYLVGDKQVKTTVSDQEREADYHHHIKPHIPPLDANRRPERLSSSSRNFQDIIYDPRIQYLPPQHEKILPSVEGKLRPLRYQRRISDDSYEKNFKPAPESTVVTHREEQNPRIINLDDKDIHATKHRRVSDLVVLSPEMSSQPSCEYHQERAYLISREHDNEWSGSRQNHMAFVPQSFPDSLPCEDPSKIVQHTDARKYSDGQRPAKMLPIHMDIAGQQPHIMNDGLERPLHYERVETSLVPPSSVRRPETFLNPTHKFVNFSQSFPTVQYSHKQLPVLHGSLRPRMISHRDGVQAKREPVNPFELDVSTSNPARFDEYGQGMQSDLAGQAIRPEYRSHYVGDGHGESDMNRKAYLNPQNNSRDVHAYERPRTGIFLREIGSGRQSISDSNILRPIELQPRPLPKHQTIQRSNPEAAHGTVERQKDISIMEMFRGNPMLELSRSDGLRRYVSGDAPPLYIRLHRICF